MANKSQHLVKAQRNEDLARRLGTESPLQYPDWAITTAFYSALHYFEAALTDKPEQHVRLDHQLKKPKMGIHDWTIKLLMVHFPAAEDAYRKLYDNSRVARYECNQYWGPKAVEAHLKHLETVKQECRSS